MKPAFVRIPEEVLTTVQGVEGQTPTLYHRGPWLVRYFFWKRPRMVFHLACRNAPALGRCMDFGGGNGVLLPSLCALFGEVTLLDRETAPARTVVKRYALANARLVDADALTYDREADAYDVVVAADVLEHFREADRAVAKIRDLLRGGGVLVTSLPTENTLYRLLRRIFRIEKPEDHFWSAKEVEAIIGAAGFHRVERRSIPLPLGILPLFSLAAWRKGT